MSARKTAKNQWCLVGNIKEEKVGPKKKPVKSFAPGAKVYCLPGPWGEPYEQLTVVGHHQQANRFVAMVTSVDKIENWRAQAAYNPRVLELLAKSARETDKQNWTSKAQVESYIEGIKKSASDRLARKNKK
ncbi:MAG: hypothetical protein ACU84Q_11470 [Gammaproteobacteria bacterium]